MDPYYRHIYRLAVTLVALPLLAYFGANILQLLGALVLLDLLDAPYGTAYTNTWEYQKRDKEVDMISYAYAILLFYPQFDERTRWLLLAFMLWRAVGVYKYLQTNDYHILYAYPDCINSTMLVFYLSTVSGTVHNYYYPFVLFGAVWKMVHERLQHRVKKHNPS